MSALNTDDPVRWLEGARQESAQVFGMVVGGLYIDAMLLVIIGIQMLYYRQKLYSSDGWAVRSLVLWIALGSMVNSGMTLANGVVLLALRYGDITALLDPRFLSSMIVLQMCIVWPIQLYYAHRAYCLWNRSKIIIAILAPILLAYPTAEFYHISNQPMTIFRLNAAPRFLVVVIAFIVMDLSITISIAWALLRTRSAFSGTQRNLERFLHISVQAQVLPSAVAFVFLVKSIAAPNYPIIYLFMCAPKVWVISAMLVINTRHGLRRDMEGERARRQNTLNLDFGQKPFTSGIPLHSDQPMKQTLGGSVGSTADQVILPRPPIRVTPSVGTPNHGQFTYSDVEKSMSHITRRKSTGSQTGFGTGSKMSFQEMITDG